MMSEVNMERIRTTLYLLSALGVAAHTMGLLGHYVFKCYMFGLSLVQYPIGKAVAESVGIAASIVLGIGAWQKHDNVIFSYIIFGTLYLILHLVCSSFMLKFMLRFLGFSLGQIQTFLYPTIVTFALLILNVGVAIFYIVQGTEVQVKIEDTNPIPISDGQVQLENFNEKPSTSSAVIAAAPRRAQEVV